nr:zf-HC2 domain-containing protein [uncultured Oscillibacter sp.]
MKYCEEFAALLDLYVDGELSAEEAARVQTHLKTCPGCRRYVDDALAIRAAFPEAEETAVPEGFAESVMAAVRESEGKKAAGRRRVYWRNVMLPLAACFALVVLLRTIPGAGKDAPADAPAAAMDTAVSYSAAESEAETYDYGAADAPAAAPYGLAAAPQAADSEASPEEADAAPPQETAGGMTPKEEGAGSSRILTAPTAAPQDGPAADNGAAEVPAPQPEEAAVTAAAEPDAAEGGGRVIRLTAAQAGELLAELPYTVEADGAHCYQLPSGDFDALLETLAEQGIFPTQEPAEDFPAGYDLVYVTKE